MATTEEEAFNSAAKDVLETPPDNQAGDESSRLKQLMVSSLSNLSARFWGDFQSYHAFISILYYSTVYSTAVGRYESIAQAVLKKTIGVKDLASLRLSLPSNLLTPEGNLSYWHYLDRPDLFAVIGESDDALERMKSVLRWSCRLSSIGMPQALKSYEIDMNDCSVSKDVRFAKGKVVKPYSES